MAVAIEIIPNGVRPPGECAGNNDPLVRYRQDFQSFLISPEFSPITDQLAQIAKELLALNRNFEGGATSPLEMHVTELRKQRAAEQRLASQVAARFNNDRDSLKRRAYDAFSWMKLQPVAELLYPLETTRTRYRQTDRQISQAEASLEAARGNIWQNQATLQAEKRVWEQRRQQAIEGWVLGDSSRVLCYALENLTDDPRGRECLFQAFAVQTGTSMPSLNAEFETLARQLPENKETPQPVVEEGDVIFKESQPEDDYQPVDWQEWGRAFSDSAWYQDASSQEQVVLAEGVVCTLGIIQRLPGGRPYIKILTPDETNELLTRQAQKLASGDLRMLADCQAMIDYLRKNPYGRGTKKLSAREATLDHKPLPWRSLNPAKIPSLRLRHESSKQLRIMYVVVKQNGKPPLIILEGEICPHREYDRKTAKKITA